MKKAIVISAVLGLCSSFNLRGVAHDAQKVGEFVNKHQKTIEQIVNDSIKVAGALSEDGFVNIGDLINEGIKTYQDATAKNVNVGDLINDGAAIVGDLTEDQLFNLGKIVKQVGNFVDKNQNTIEQGAQTVGDVVTGNYVGAVDSGIKTVDDATNQLFNLGKIVKQVGTFVDKNQNTIEQGAQTVGDVVTGNYVGAVDSGIKTVDDATNQLFNLGKIVKQVGTFVDKNQNTIEQGAQTVGDVVTGNYVGAVDSGIKTVDDATNQLFNLGKIGKEVGTFVDKNQKTIEQGAQTVGDVVTGNYVGAVDSGIKTVDDATNQLFNLGKIVKQVGTFVDKNQNTIEQGAQTVGDVVTGNYVGAVDSGIKTVDDATNQLFNLGKIGKEVGTFVDKNQKTIEQGAQTVGDVVTGNYVGAVDSGIKTVDDATNQLFNLGKIAKQVGSFVDKNQKTIEQGAQTVGDVVTGNYVGAVSSGIKTVGDATH